MWSRTRPVRWSSCPIRRVGAAPRFDDCIGTLTLRETGQTPIRAKDAEGGSGTDREGAGDGSAADRSEGDAYVSPRPSTSSATDNAGRSMADSKSGHPGGSRCHDNLNAPHNWPTPRNYLDNRSGAKPQSLVRRCEGVGRAHRNRSENISVPAQSRCESCGRSAAARLLLRPSAGDGICARFCRTHTVAVATPR